jgi:site-specific DNA-methyltransferase (adenine-specific)
LINNKLLSGNFSFDKISDEYEEMLSESFRNKEGIYYTPPFIVKNLMLEIAGDLFDSKFCDPCCGTGNFLIEAFHRGFKPENIYGYDTDHVAVNIAKKRFFQATGFTTENIKVADFLIESTKKESITFDYIYTNPPWGKKLPKEEKESYGYSLGAIKSLDTCSLFLLASLKCIKKNGSIGFLLPDSFFNVANFEEARIRALSLEVSKIIDYGKPFKGLMTKAIGIILKNRICTQESPSVICVNNGKHYDRTIESFLRNPKSIINYQCTPEDEEVIQHVYKIPHKTLYKNAEWGLGIVTGNNAKFCRTSESEGYIPVYRGSDIKKSGILNPTCFIPDDMSLYQQVAPMEIYRAKRKIIYKFITNEICFFYDEDQRYVLNSANILVPSENLEITGQQLCELLNSKFIGWLYSVLFMTNKVLRGDLEQLPIHTDFFKQHNEFKEDAFLDFVSIERRNDGTYRVKR